MTDTSDVFGPVSTTAELAQEVADLKVQLATARATAQDARRSQEGLFEAFQEALLGLDDEDQQEVVKDFLEEVTGREFHLTQLFTAVYEVRVTFRARTMEAAEEVMLEVDMSCQARGDEVEDFEVEEVSQTSCDEG